MKDLEAGGESNVFTSFILNHKYFQKISLYSPERLIKPLIKAKIAKRMHVNYPDIIHSAPSLCTK